MDWIDSRKILPKAIIGPAQKPPEISEDVLCFWDEGQPMDVGYYDHAEKGWYSANSYAEFDAPPACWCALTLPKNVSASHSSPASESA